MIDKESVNEAIRSVIARQILEGIDGEARDALLSESIAKALGDYRFTSGIADVVADKARRVIAEMVECREWDRRIRETIAAGFDDYLANLRAAVPEVLKEAMHGRKGPDSYSTNAGLVLRCWPKKEG